MKLKSAEVLFILTIISCLGCTSVKTPKAPLQYVDPLIGTAPSSTISAHKHGNGTENNAQVIPEVTAPFGMTNWTAQTRDVETKCVAPYYYNDSIINGFRGTHWLSGSCVQDYGSMTIMPISGALKWLPNERGSRYSHRHENATPYLYQVTLEDYQIEASITATTRCGMLKFTFNQNQPAHIVVNPNSDEGQGFVQLLPEQNEIIGYNPVHRIYQGWGEPAGFSGYFVARFSHDFSTYGTYENSILQEKALQATNRKKLGAYASFEVEKGTTITVCIGTSFTSIDQARKNLDAEIGNQSFQEIENSLKNSWEQLLNKVQVEGKNEVDKTKFYTALYHCFLQPRTFNDVDGSYVSFAGGKEVLNSGSSNYYVDFSMWDTYRASHPLFNLLTPDQNSDMMASLISKANQGDWLPIFPCWNSYTSAMIGDHAIATLADAYTKNIIDISDDAYAYLIKNAFEVPDNFKDYKNGKGRRALSSYLKYGYIPMEDSVKESFHKQEQVSRTLEYAFDDFALMQIARMKKDTLHAAALLSRAYNYKNVYSRTDTCVRGRYSNGEFIAAFDKSSRMSYITEGTPWQYTFYVPHDIGGLMELMGGSANFAANLDRFHATDQYWHGNEPGHQIPFLYNYSGQAWKTQQLVSRIMKEEYDAGVGGLSGNDDAGQMSAWYVFASLGFYPVCPSVPEYVISGPHFDKITLNLNKGKKLTILAKGASIGKNYIQKVFLNGKEHKSTFINHFDLTNGGTFEFKMGSSPNRSWGTGKNEAPYSLSNDHSN